MKKGKLVIIAVALIIAAALVVGGCLLLKKPNKSTTEKVCDALSATGDVMIKDSNFVRVLNNASKKGSVSISFVEGAESLVDIKLYLDEIAKKMFVDADLGVAGEQVNVNLQLDGTRVAIGSEAFFGAEKYGFDINTAFDDLKGSAWLQVLGMSEEEYAVLSEEYKDVLKKFSDALAEAEKAESANAAHEQKDVSAILEKLEKAIVSTEKSDAQVTVKYALGPNVLVELIDLLEDQNEKEFEKLFKTLEEESGQKVTLEDVKTLITSAELTCNVDFVLDNDMKFVKEVKVDVVNICSAAVKFSGIDDGDAQKKEISLVFDVKAEGLQYALIWSYDTVEKQYEIAVKENDETLMTIDGDYGYTEDTFYLSINSDAEDVEDVPSIQLELNENDEMPAFKEYVDIPKMSAEDIMSMLELFAGAGY